MDSTERPEPKSKIDAVAVTKGLAKGMLNGVAAPVKGIVSALKHPKATHDKAVRDIEAFLADPFGVIAHGASATFDAYMNASPEEQAEMLGTYIPAIEFAVAAGGLVVGEPAASMGGDPQVLSRMAKMEELLKNPNIDCNDIASILKSEAGGGKIVSFEMGAGKTLRVPECGKIIDDYIYHDVFSDGKFIYDPRYSAQAVPQSEYLSMMQKLNPGVKVTF